MSNEIPEYNSNIVGSGARHHTHHSIMELVSIRIDNIWQLNKTSFWYPLWKSKNGRTFALATNEISATRWSLLRLGLCYLMPLSTIVAVRFMGVGNRSIRRKPPTCRQSPTHFSVTNNLIVNIAVIPEIMFKFLTFDSMVNILHGFMTKETTVVLSLHIFAK